MKILVTGGAGFIGSHVADAYVAAGHNVVVLDDLSSGNEDNVAAGAKLERMDIASPEAAALIAEWRPDIVNHHAAQMNVRLSVEDPSFDARVNVLGFLNIMQAAHLAGTSRVLFSSSGGTVYGEPEAVPTTEQAPLIPVCPYGVTKLTGEHYLEYYARMHGMHYVAFRYANVYGPRQDPRGEAGVISIFCEKFLAGEQPTIFGDGLQTRDYVFVGDVVRANLAGLECAYRGPVNIGTGIETNVIELAAQLQRLIGSNAQPQFAAARDGEVLRSALNCDRAASALGWRPETSLADGLTVAVEYFRA